MGGKRYASVSSTYGKKRGSSWPGTGPAGPVQRLQVLQAWQDCLAADPTCEEAASALMRLDLAEGRRSLAVEVYDRCTGALGGLGLKNPHLPSTSCVGSRTSPGLLLGPSRLPAVVGSRAPMGERRLVTVVCIGLEPAGLDVQTDPEDLHELSRNAVAQAISEIEGLEGTVASVSAFGVSALFGLPQSHEDDPEPRGPDCLSGRVLHLTPRETVQAKTHQQTAAAGHTA